MIGWPAFYGILTVIVVGLAIASPVRDEVLPPALMLALLFIFSNLSHVLLRINDPYNAFYMILDAGAAIMLALSWRHELNSWRVCLILLFLFDCMAHVVYRERGDTSFRARYAYDLTLNLLYIGQLACIAIPSAWALWGRKLPVWSA